MSARTAAKSSKMGKSGGPPSSRNPDGEFQNLKDVQLELMYYLYDNPNPVVDNAFAKIEDATKFKREQVVYGFGGCLALYLIFGSLAELICNFIGMGYPTYASVKAIKSTTKDDDTIWLIYWTVYATFTLIDFFAERIMSILPLYWLAKVIFLVYLACPQTKGAMKLYKKVVLPLADIVDCALCKYAGVKSSKAR